MLWKPPQSTGELFKIYTFIEWKPSFDVHVNMTIYIPIVDF